MSDAADFPQPEITPLNAPYWDALTQGYLVFQHCDSCRFAVLPARSECPRCLQPTLSWTRSTGAAKLISWVVYHQAFHPAFASRVPYTVAVVELSEGARLVANIVGADDPERLRIEMPLVLSIEREAGVAIPKFRPVMPYTG